MQWNITHLFKKKKKDKEGLYVPVSKGLKDILSNK